MSKYYKAEDVISAIDSKIAEYIPTLYGRYGEIPLELRMTITSLPTIEVSEDCISREDLLKHAYKREGVLSVSVESIKLAPSVVPQVPSEDCISREFALEVISDYVNYPTEGDKTCAIKNAPSVTTEQSSMVGEVHKPDYSYESELMKRISDTNTNAPGSKSHMLRPPCEQCPDWGNCKDGCLYERPKR